MDNFKFLGYEEWLDDNGNFDYQKFSYQGNIYLRTIINGLFWCDLDYMEVNQTLKKDLEYLYNRHMREKKLKRILGK